MASKEQHNVYKRIARADYQWIWPTRKLKSDDIKTGLDVKLHELAWMFQKLLEEQSSSRNM